MKIKITAFGIARDILKSKHMEWDLKDKKDIASLKESLFLQYPEFKKLRSLSFAADDQYRDDQYQIREAEEIIIIPPVSGG